MKEKKKGGEKREITALDACVRLRRHDQHGTHALAIRPHSRLSSSPENEDCPSPSWKHKDTGPITLRRSLERRGGQSRQPAVRSGSEKVLDTVSELFLFPARERLASQGHGQPFPLRRCRRCSGHDRIELATGDTDMTAEQRLVHGRKRRQGGDSAWQTGSKHRKGWVPSAEAVAHAAHLHLVRTACDQRRVSSLSLGRCRSRPASPNGHVVS